MVAGPEDLLSESHCASWLLAVGACSRADFPVCGVIHGTASRRRRSDSLLAKLLAPSESRKPESHGVSAPARSA